MPSNNDLLLNENDVQADQHTLDIATSIAKFNSLFSQFDLDEDTVKQLQLNIQRQAVLTYYQATYESQDNSADADAVLASFNRFTDSLRLVLASALTADEAYDAAKTGTDSYSSSISLYNVACICEAIAYFIVFSLSLFTTLVVGIPLLFVCPPLGFFVFLATSLCTFVASDAFFDSIYEIKSHDGIAEEAAVEKDLIGFFASKPKKREQNQSNSSNVEATKLVDSSNLTNNNLDNSETITVANVVEETNQDNSVLVLTNETNSVVNSTTMDNIDATSANRYSFNNTSSLDQTNHDIGYYEDDYLCRIS